jgi:predicted RNA-binding protein
VTGAITYWLIVETPENWNADKNRSFSSLGISDRFKVAAQRMKPGDLVISYVSRAQAFADVRKVESSKPKRATRELGYDRPFQWEIGTAPLITLTRENWVGIHPLVEELELTRGKKRWGPIFLTAVRTLKSSDGSRLVSELRAVSTLEGARIEGVS